ncbi:pre-peptidase C-terminal domain-containing protein [Pseudoalteromonas sp. C2R02]|uniref:pre-peptidase C-terminal domain-containing protein n=1 Tax=Pseudoalteromonas sp. C2R02 TaxID=2841565 RepID=UPI001C093076|nr:pre-peptidase C-terminal domain-containing protein [Pseudoalteromonas sp. C2R02]MBU2968555.1 pre-peptidase C-terminal domain-containing protein [Pseudoalteromonas sp. C2R02]
MKYNDNKISKVAKHISIILGSTALVFTLTEPAIAIEKKVINDSHTLQSFNGAQHMDTVSPELFNGDVRDLTTVEPWSPGDPVKSIPRRIYPNFNKSPLNGPINAVIGNDDHLVKLQNDAQNTYNRAVTDGSVNIDGIGFTGVNPSDPTGTVGKNHYIQSINGNNGALFSIFDKATGNKVSGPTAMSTLATNLCKNALGDPIVFYDEAAQRYVMTEFSNQTGRSLCVYVSKTDNPVTGGWYAYEFQAPEFPDYPKFGRWGDSYYVGTNENAGPGIYAIERSKLLAGQTARMQRKTAPKLSGLGFQMLLPVDVDTVEGPEANTPGLFLRQNDDEINNKGSNNANQDYLELWTFNPDYDNSANSQLTGPIKIAMSEFDSDVCTSGAQGYGCLKQKGSTKTLDPVREVVMYRAQYRKFSAHESIVGNFIHDAGSDRAGIRWFELRKVGSGSWQLHQEGTYAPSGTDNRFMGSAAMDGSGNIALSYHIAGVDTYPGISMTGRLSTDTKGTMTQAEKVIVAGTSHIASDRNGDYSHLSIDPVDNCTFWMTSDYGKEGGKWATRIANFKFASCGGSTTPDFSIQATNLTQQVCANADLKPITISSAATGGFNKAINLTYSDLPTGITGSFTKNPLNIGSNSDASVKVGDINTGNYKFKINGTADGVSAKTLDIAVTVANKPGAVSLTSPSAGTNDVAIRPTLSWQSDASATGYRIEIATDSAFNNIVANGTVNNGTNYQPSADLTANTTYYWRVRADNGCGNVWSSSATFTTTAINASALVKGIAKSNLTGDANTTADFTFEVPFGATDLSFKTSGGSGDVDMHVKFGQKATADTYDCRPYETGNTETCNISNIQTGTYHVMLLGYQAYSGVNLIADYTAASQGNDKLEESNLSGTSSTKLYHTINVPSGMNELVVNMSGGTGDADLYVRHGEKPTTASYKCRPYKAGNNESCTISDPQAGVWHIGVFGFEDFSNIDLSASSK